MAHRVVWPLAAALMASVACSKDEPTDTAPLVESGSESPPAPTPTPASASASASAPTPTSAPTSTSTSASAPASATASASRAPAAACGDKPLPPCPLYAWMKANMGPAMSAEDFDALAASLEKAASFAPASGYANWTSISNDGASAAHVQNLDAVKAACRGCHNQYKAKYKKEMRGRPL